MSSITLFLACIFKSKYNSWWNDRLLELCTHRRASSHSHLQPSSKPPMNCPTFFFFDNHFQSDGRHNMEENIDFRYIATLIFYRKKACGL